MAGLTPQPVLRGTEAATPAALSSLQFFRTIAWLRWRTFANGLRGKGAMGELAVTILSYFVLALIVIGPSFGAGFTAWYLVSHHLEPFLAIPLWIIFLLWQFLGASTSASGPTFSLDSLIRFPIRYRDYLLMRLTFGLMDPPTLAGLGCLISMTLGIGIAAPSLLPWAALSLATYALCNLFFSRMIYTWLERWLAQRKTRELVAGLILIGSLGMQFASQFINRFTGVDHRAPSPWMRTTIHSLVAVNRILPPGLTASSIALMRARGAGLALLSYAALLAFTAVFLYILHLRLHAQYLGENLSEAPRNTTPKTSRPKRASAVQQPSALAASHSALLSPQITAMLRKERLMLLRSGPRLYALIMPVFVVYIFSFRTAGLAQLGVDRPQISQYLFTYGCAYTLLIFTNLFYNSLGNEGAGVQFYFLAPISMRDILLAKNLLITLVFALDIVLVYAATLTLQIETPLNLIAATLCWTAFVYVLHIAIGNARSLIAPKGVDPARVRRQNVSAVSSFISLGITFAAAGLGQLTLVLCRAFHVSLWTAAALFLLLAILAFALYVLVLKRSDTIAADHREELARELGKF